MYTRLIHFPDFVNAYYSPKECDNILNLLKRIKEKTECVHISHVYRDKNVKQLNNNSGFGAVITFPPAWCMEYFARNYQELDPILHESAPHFLPHLVGQVRDIRKYPYFNAEMEAYLKRAEFHGLGNFFVAASIQNAKGPIGCTIYTFDLPVSEREFLIRTKSEQLLLLSAELHHSLSTFMRQNEMVELLTQREADCLSWAAKGKTDSEIAQILNIARWTVVNHLQNAKNKLGCTNKTSAVAVALSLGIIEKVDARLQKPNY